MASLIHCHSSTQILLKQGYANHHKKFKQCHGVIINIRRKQLTRAIPAIRGAICFVDRVDDAIVFNSITEVCISFDDDPLRAELSPAKEGTGVKIGESAVEQCTAHISDWLICHEIRNEEGVNHLHNIFGYIY